MTPGEQTRDFYRKQGAEAEQKRIIKLLTETSEGLTALIDMIDTGEDKAFIALIKGEK